MKKNFKKNIKHVIIFYKAKDKKIINKVKEISDFLKKRNISFDRIHQEENKAFKKADLIICLGGDGTYLKAIQFGKNTATLGINMGSLGFLTPHKAQESLQLIKRTLNGNMFLKKNYFLKACLYQGKASFLKKIKESPHKISEIKKTKEIQSFYSVNDIVVERGDFSHLIHVSIFTNKEYIYSLKGDGLIISSPIGSTAYNLASGGPILHPKVSSLVITPICSHSLTNRPVVIPDSLEIYLRFNQKKSYLTIDGLTKAPLSDENILLIKKSSESFFSITEKEDREFALLRKKLKFGQRD